MTKDVSVPILVEGRFISRAGRDITRRVTETTEKLRSELRSEINTRASQASVDAITNTLNSGVTSEEAVTALATVEAWRAEERASRELAVSQVAGRVSALETSLPSKAERAEVREIVADSLPDMTRYATKADLANYTPANGGAGGGGGAAVDLSGYATTSEVNRLVKQIATDTSPFKTGERYYSPVTYYWPDYYNGERSQWSKVLRFGSALGIVILNRNSGDWQAYDGDFHTQARLAKGAGAKRTIFYVKTQYAAAGNPKTWGVGVPNPEKFTKEYILQQLAYCKAHYPDVFQGVFLDEFINGWGDQAERTPWYKELVDAIRKEYGPEFTIVGNCGSNCTPELLDLDVDVFMSYEYTAERYLKDDPNSPIHTQEMAKHPGTRFWHVVHDVTEENYQAVFARAEGFGVGHLYITDGRLVMGEGGQWVPEVNPYASAPSEWITKLIVPWLKGYLDTRLLSEKTAKLVSELQALVKDLGTRVTKLEGK